MRLEAAQRERAAVAREQERLKYQAGQQPKKAAPEQRPEEKRHRDLAWLTEKFPTMAASEIENVLDEHRGAASIWLSRRCASQRRPRRCSSRPWPRPSRRRSPRRRAVASARCFEGHLRKYPFCRPEGGGSCLIETGLCRFCTLAVPFFRCKIVRFYKPIPRHLFDLRPLNYTARTSTDYASSHHITSKGRQIPGTAPLARTPHARTSQAQPYRDAGCRLQPAHIGCTTLRRPTRTSSAGAGARVPPRPQRSPAPSQAAASSSAPRRL